MSKAPTLLTRGSLFVRGEPVDEVPEEFIVSWFKRRMPEFGGHDASVASRILIVRAETGSGKSTVLPVALLRILRSKDTPAKLRYRGQSVIVTQPRVLTAMALAADVSSRPWNPDIKMDVSVGYQTGPVTNKPIAGLIFATAGVLAAQLGTLEDDALMAKYRFIVVDEAHERSIDSDILLASLRRFYERNANNPRLPFLVLASATFDPERYRAYFGVPTANVVEVRGRTFEITPMWPATGTNDFVAAAVKAAGDIHEANPDDPPERADVLIFAPGGSEATAISRGLEKANRGWEAGPAGPALVLVINREVIVAQERDFRLVFVPPAALPTVNGRRVRRRIIVSTVVAETGLTVDTLKYVIDAGWNRSRECYQPWSLEGLVTRPAPQSRIKQRKGRVGRLFPGEFHPLYTQNVFNALESQQLPEIITLGAADVYLRLIREQVRQKIRLGLQTSQGPIPTSQGPIPTSQGPIPTGRGDTIDTSFRLEDLGLLDPPPAEAILAANSRATALGFVSPDALLPTAWPVDALALAGHGPVGIGHALALEGHGPGRGYGLTPLGHIAAGFSRASMESARLILAAYEHDVAASDVLTIAALLGDRPDSLLMRVDQKALPSGAAALRASLPPFLIERVGGAKGPRMPPTEAEMFYYRAKLLIADDFVESLLMFDAFARRVDIAAGDFAAISEWCEASGLDISALSALARKRAGLADEMAALGLDPFRQSNRMLSQSTIETFTPILIAIKHCIYDALCWRLITDGGSEPVYVTTQGLKLKVPPLFDDKTADRLMALGITAEAVKPRWLVTDAYRFAKVPKSKSERVAPFLYLAAAGRVSCLDGFVDPDLGFDAPRTFGVK